MGTRRALAFSAPILLVSLALLAGCGGAGAAADAPTATAPAAPATTATPSALPELPTVQVASGQCQQDTAGDVVYTPAGGLVVTQTTALGNLAYPSLQIPSQQTAPMTVPLIPANPFAPSTVLPVNPRLQEGGGGFVLLICNLSSQAHVVSAVQASIARIRTVSGQLSAWDGCSNGTFGMTSGGCGGAGDQQDDYMHAAFAPNASEGATVTTTLSRADPYGVGPLPVTLKPGRSMTIEVGVTTPSAPGYYTYGFALTVDGVSTGIVAYSPETVLAPVTQQWGGTCTPPQQTQIAEIPTPTVGRNTYICPES